MIILHKDTLSLIPQRPPFVMIDHLVGCDEDGTQTTFRVEQENVLVFHNKLSEAGLVENIAQTAAAGAGYIALKSNEPVLTGYIGAIKNLEVFALPKTGDVIETTVTIINKVFDVTIIAGSVECDGKLLAKCEMKMFIEKLK
ncbi:3-hydroxyacyl-ACP dehydratase [Mucilaginibacter sp. dw_454]|uniref:3-hydroxyacyl-ACP dehydratase n=1 Tax=Mucilaginibacter sp. dw_454 TaxID=2720079 RepID=UPI001C4A07E8|nr:3-hydroxyacyl-ACP dehydratase [Mucilaginibacter sp. dw_454]